MRRGGGKLHPGCRPCCTMRGSSALSSRSGMRLRRVRRWLLPACLLPALVFPIADAGGRGAKAPTLVVDNSFALDTLYPHRAFDPTSVIVDRAIYDTLFTYRRGDTSHPVPLLGRSWKSSGGSKKFTLQLKKNVHFAD